MSHIICDRRTWRPILPQTALKSGRAEKRGTLTMQPARRPVPRLDGQVKIQPRCSECMKSAPSAWRTFWICWVPLANRVMMDLMSSPFSMETIRIWSSSLIQTKRLASSLWKIPRASGQCRPHPEERRRVESGS